MIKVILWDIDATLLSFELAEKAAFFKCFEICGIAGCNEEMLKRYSKINHGYWEKLERNEITKPEVLVGRFIEFFATEKITLPSDCNSVEELAVKFNDEYQIRLGDTVYFNDNSDELVKKLKGQYLQYIVTNGTAIAQYRKLERSGLDQIVDGWFISDEIGVEKPNKGFFDAVWAKLGDVKKEEVLIVGDSLTSDMRGGNNEGILCCWYNPSRKPNTTDVHVDYEITNIWEVEEILSKLA